MNKPLFSAKHTEEVLSSVVFLISCVERIENRLRLIEARVRDMETAQEHLARRAVLPDPARPSAAARLVAAEAAPATGVKAIAVIVPVHNAPEETAECLASIFENGGYAKLIVIDDASGKATADQLDASARRRDFIVIRNPKNLGYTKSINIGIAAAGAVDAIVILNSDTVVTAGWLPALARAFDANPRAGIVGPWSNAATYQSLPAVKDGSGQFAVNALPAGLSPDDWSLALAHGKAAYPRVPVVNGFCFAVRKSVFDRIGAFDEAAFPIGYGEENDFCVRATQAGFEIVVADDAFVFHGKSKSFGAARRKELAAAGRAMLERKHGAARIRQLVGGLERSAALTGAREAAAKSIVSARANSIFADFGGTIGYVLPAKPSGGGVNSIIQEASFLAAQGVPATVFVPAAEVTAFHEFYGKDVHTLVRGYRNIHDLHMRLQACSVIVATVYRSVALVRDLIDTTAARFFYYVQDYEPFFHEEGSPEYREALASYDVDPRFTMFAKTKWLQQTIRERHGRAVQVVLASLDHDTFFPAPAKARRNRIAAMVRPSTPRRSPAETVALARALATRRGKRLSVSLFGCDPDDPVFNPVRGLARVERVGRLKRDVVADLLRNSDIFVDLSTYQAFGRASIEGMACGCVPIVPEKGGGAEYAVPGWNSFTVDVADPGWEKTCLAHIDAIYADLDGLRANAIATASRYTVRGAAVSILKTFRQA